MSSWLKRLSETLAHGQLVRIDRQPMEEDMLDGYVVGTSEKFVLLHVLDPNMYLNGYSAIRVDDIKRYRVLEDNDFFANKALELREQFPKPLQKLSLFDLRSLIETANRLYPIITIHREKMDNTVCFIGKVAKLTDKTLSLYEISPSAKWERTRRYYFRDITKVDFGGGYEEALWLVAKKGKHKRRSKA